MSSQKNSYPYEIYDGIYVGMSVETNVDCKSMLKKETQGKVIRFKNKEQTHPVAVLDNGEELSVFWLQEKN